MRTTKEQANEIRKIFGGLNLVVDVRAHRTIITLIGDDGHKYSAYYTSEHARRLAKGATSIDPNNTQIEYLHTILLDLHYGLFCSETSEGIKYYHYVYKYAGIDLE